MNCCQGEEHKHGDNKQNKDHNNEQNSNPGWLSIVALLIIVVLVGSMLFMFLK